MLPAPDAEYARKGAGAGRGKRIGYQLGRQRRDHAARQDGHWEAGAGAAIRLSGVAAHAIYPQHSAVWCGSGISVGPPNIGSLLLVRLRLALASESLRGCAPLAESPAARTSKTPRACRLLRLSSCLGGR